MSLGKCPDCGQEADWRIYVTGGEVQYDGDGEPERALLTTAPHLHCGHCLTDYNSLELRDGQVVRKPDANPN